MPTCQQNPRRLINNNRKDTLDVIKTYCYNGRYNNHGDLAHDMGISRSHVNNRLALGFTAGEIIVLAQATDTNPVLLLEKFGFINNDQATAPESRDPDVPTVEEEINKAMRQAAQAMTQAAEAYTTLQQLSERMGAL